MLLGSVLFNFFINYLELGSSSVTAIFVEDIKLFRRQILKNYRDSSKWVRVPHQNNSNRNPNFTHIWMGSELVVTEFERDLGVIVDSVIKMST